MSQNITPQQWNSLPPPQHATQVYALITASKMGFARISLTQSKELFVTMDVSQESTELTYPPAMTVRQENMARSERLQRQKHVGTALQGLTAMRLERQPLAIPAAQLEGLEISKELVQWTKVARLHALWENTVTSWAKHYSAMPAHIHAKRENMVLVLAKSQKVSVKCVQMDFTVATVSRIPVHWENMANLSSV